jgi:uncharacterized protein YdhG (YjbR/CyaY superfamily)
VDSKGARYSSVDEYIATFPREIQEKLEEVRATIRAAAPDAQEKISYQMPTFALEGNLVHFAALKGHIGFYPTSSGVAAFQKELAPYASTPGAVRFPIDQPLPTDLISKIVRLRVTENRNRAAAKSRKSKGNE